VGVVADVTMASQTDDGDASVVALPKKTLLRADLQQRRQSTDRINDILEVRRSRPLCV
jgi:hypothetical protein